MLVYMGYSARTPISPTTLKRKITAGIKDLADMVVRHRANRKGMMAELSWSNGSKADEDETMAEVEISGEEFE